VTVTRSGSTMRACCHVWCKATTGSAAKRSRSDDGMTDSVAPGRPDPRPRRPSDPLDPIEESVDVSWRSRGKDRRGPSSHPGLTGAVSEADGYVGEATVAVEAATDEGSSGSVDPADWRSSNSVFALDEDRSLPEPLAFDTSESWVRLPPRSSWLRRALIVSVVFGVVAGFAGVWAARWLHSQIHPAGPHGAALVFTVGQGQDTNAVASQLAAKHVIANATVFRYWLRHQGGEQTFRAGDYDLFQRMDYPELVAILRAGPRPPIQIKVTVPPGLNVVQMQKLLLDKLPGLNPVELNQAFKRRELDPNYAQPPFGIREGLFAPDTYNVDPKAATNSYSLLIRMRDQMDKVLLDLNANARAEQLGYSVYDILKVASLIEEEAKVDADRPKIARVIYNRLARDVPLGIDASTRYAVGKTAGEPLTVADLASDSAYNTRKAFGLPPTPISAPGRASIDAALSPTPDQAWLYYVLTDDAGVKGAHTFINTAAEFEAAKAICKQKGYCE
jgi:uncharacterized YceG family protein